MAYRPSAARNQSSASAPKVPNLVPIMNLFLTIVPFLMLMLVITQVALVAFNFTEGASGGEGSAGGGADQKERLEVTVIIMASVDDNRTTYPGFEIRVTPADKGTSPDSLGLFNGQYDYKALDLTLQAIKNSHSNLNDISIAAYDDVPFEILMKTIDVCRKNNFPNVHYKAPQVRYFGQGSAT